VVREDGTVVFGSVDHKPYDEGEKKRIEEAGGYVQLKRVNGDLAVSRALGDFVYKQNKPGNGEQLAPPENQQVSCIPDVTIIPREEDIAFLVLACDGVWDVMDNERCAKYLVDVSSSCFGVPARSPQSPCHPPTLCTSPPLTRASFHPPTTWLSP
jgi:serine/threonine protein phosphatase PrpC